MNKICLSKYEWKKDQDECKKDGTYDLHPLIKSMIENASTAKRNKAGELCKDFLALYSSKTNGGLDIKLCQLFKNDNTEEVVFSEGVLTNFWAGNFCRVHKSAPGTFSPFSFTKMQPVSTNNDKDRSLFIDIYLTQKGGLMSNLDNVKASAKMTVSVPQDYLSSAFQVETYTLSSKYIFGIDSLLTRQHFLFVDKVKHHSIAYKNQLASYKNFAVEILWQSTNLSTFSSNNATDVTTMRMLTNATSI
jgi:hypothetical protein